MEAQSDTGGAKKFLYTGPKKDEDEEDLPWSFNPKAQKQGAQNDVSKFEMDNVWSIQRNVNLNGATSIRSPKSDNLNYSTNKGYYSRYGGDKDKDGGIGNAAKNDADSNGGKSWNVGNPSRRPFSYAFGTDPPSTYEKPISPRNESNSSAGVYPQTTSKFSVGVIQNGSQSSRVANSGTNQNFTKGNNYSTFGSGNFTGITSPGNGGVGNDGTNSSVQSKPATSPTSNFGVSQTYGTKNRNSLFTSSQPKGTITQNDLFNPKSSIGGGSPTRQNKSFW